MLDLFLEGGWFFFFNWLIYCWLGLVLLVLEILFLKYDVIFIKDWL